MRKTQVDDLRVIKEKKAVESSFLLVISLVLFGILALDFRRSFFPSPSFLAPSPSQVEAHLCLAGHIKYTGGQTDIRASVEPRAFVFLQALSSGPAPLYVCVWESISIRSPITWKKMRSLTAYDVRSHDDVNLELVGLLFSTNTPLCERLFLSYFWELDRNHNDFV